MFKLFQLLATRSGMVMSARQNWKYKLQNTNNLQSVNLQNQSICYLLGFKQFLFTDFAVIWPWRCLGLTTAIQRCKKQQLELVADVQRSQLQPFWTSCISSWTNKCKLVKTIASPIASTELVKFYYPLYYPPNWPSVLVALVTNTETRWISVCAEPLSAEARLSISTLVSISTSSCFRIRSSSLHRVWILLSENQLKSIHAPADTDWCRWTVVPPLSGTHVFVISCIQK